MTNYAVGTLMTSPEEVYEFYKDYHDRFTSGLVTLKGWKEETLRRMRALYRHAKRYGFQPYDPAAEALLEVYEHVLWHIQWREEGFRRLHGDNWPHPDRKTTDNNNVGREHQ